VERKNKGLTDKDVIYVVMLIAFFLTIFYSHAFIIEFGAAVIGVFLAFAFNRLWQDHKDDETRKRLTSDICGELRRIRERLTDKGNLLRRPIWNSAIASGQLKLLGKEIVRELAEAYEDIENTEYTAIKSRECNDLIKKATSKKEIEALKPHKLHFEEKHLKREKGLRERLDNLSPKLCKE